MDYPLNEQEETGKTGFLFSVFGIAYIKNISTFR